MKANMLYLNPPVREEAWEERATNFMELQINTHFIKHDFQFSTIPIMTSWSGTDPSIWSQKHEQKK